MKKIYSLIICAIALSGCSTPAIWEYTPKEYTNKDEAKYSIQIPQFTDAREEAAEDVLKGGKVALHWAPLVLYSNVTDVHHPEESLVEISDMSTVFPQATGAELASSGLFKTISVLPSSKEKTDYTLKGTIINTKATKTLTSYGLSFAGSAVSLLGIPSGIARNSITVQFQLVDKKGNVVFEKKYTDRSSRPVYVYTEFSKSYFAPQAEVYQHINRLLIKDLKENIFQ